MRFNASRVRIFWISLTVLGVVTTVTAIVAPYFNVNIYQSDPMLAWPDNAAVEVIPLYSDEELATRLHQRIQFGAAPDAGTRLMMAGYIKTGREYMVTANNAKKNGDDATYQEYSTKAHTKFLEAALVASQGPKFADTILHWASQLLEPSSNIVYNDFTVSIAAWALYGNTTATDSDGLRRFDARKILFTSLLPKGSIPGFSLPPTSHGNNNHYEALGQYRLSTSSDLRGIVNFHSYHSVYTTSPVPPDQIAGVATHRAFAKLFMNRGTNRKMFERIFALFLCAPITDVRNKAYSDHRVPPDVTRCPGGSNVTYEQECRSCHAPMDAATGFSYALDWQRPNDLALANEEQNIVHTSSLIAPKIVANDRNTPDTCPNFNIPRPIDNSWEILFVPPNISANFFNWNPNVHWNPQLNRPAGLGPKSFMETVAHAGRYPYCLAKRITSFMCNLNPENIGDTLIHIVATDLVNNNYDLGRTFLVAAALPLCLGR